MRQTIEWSYTSSCLILVKLTFYQYITYMRQIIEWSHTSSCLIIRKTDVLPVFSHRLTYYQPTISFYTLKRMLCLLLSYGSSARIYYNGCSARNINNFVMQAPCKASGQTPHTVTRPASSSVSITGWHNTKRSGQRKRCSRSVTFIFCTIHHKQWKDSMKSNISVGKPSKSLDNSGSNGFFQ